MSEREPINRPTWRTVLHVHDRLVRDYLREPDERHLARLVTQQAHLEQELARPGRFELGLVVATPGARDAVIEAAHVPAEFLLRHKQGNWGELPPEDAAENERAVADGSRIFSRYRTRLDGTLWVITEWDRSATTMLLPEEY